MKIDSSLPATAVTGGSGRTPAAAAPAKSAPAAGAAPGEKVDISSLSARLQEAGAGAAPFDAQRVAEIRQAIGAGRFQINPERIADGLLDGVREMLAVKPRE